MMQQGYGPEQIRAGLQQAGWDTAAAAQIVAFYFAPQQSMQSAHPLRRATLKRFIILLVACLVIGGGVGAYMLLKDRSGQHNDPHSKQDEHQSKDITNQPSADAYTEFAQLKGTTLLLSKKWTTKPRSEPSSYVSILNFDPGAVASELKADDRYPRNANFYHDVKRRDLKTYPYSLDKMYEVQLFSRQLPIPATLTEEAIKTQEKDKIEDLQMYKVNGITVADYITKPGENALDQRIILIRDQAGTKEVTVVINPNQSRDKITKDNFDGLMELIGSIKFVP